MRGSPLILTAFLALGLLLAGIPVWSLTRPHPHETPVAAPSSAPATTRPLELKITSTSAALVELRQSGQLIWQSQSPAESFTQTLPAAADADFVASVRWLDAAKQNAIRFEFSRDGDALADKTLWGEGQTEDVLSVTAP